MTNMPANSALTGASVTEGGFKTALDQALDAIRERVENGTTGMVTADLEPGTDAAEDLGASAKRYRNLYLSGGLYIGGTASANLLTDYEEGTFTPSLLFGGGNTGMNASASGSYTKIGRLVTFRGFITLTAKGSSTGSATIDGLPFTSGSGNANAPITLFYTNLNINTGGGFYTGIGTIANNTTAITLLEIGSNVGVTALTDADFSNTSTLRFTGFYHT